MISDEGITNIIVAMLRYVAQDIRYGSKAVKEDALEFLESDWYKELCDVLGLNAKKLKQMILSNKVSWRDKYE